MNQLIYGALAWFAGVSPLLGATQAPTAMENPTAVVTVTGCMRENPGRPGAYVLDSAENGAEKTYRLIGSATADLKPQVGHKVKVTGTVAKSATAPSGAGLAESPAMNVTIVALVADTCGSASK